MSDGTAIALAVVLLFANAFFVGAEFAVISARRSRIEPMAEAGNRGARATLRAMENVSLMLAGSQLGITVCSLGLGALGEPAVAHLIEPYLERLGAPEGLVHPIAFAVALLVVVYLHVVVGEMVPKNISIAGPERAALVLVPPMLAFVMAVRPLLMVLNGCANLVLRAVTVTPADEVESAFTREQVAGMIGESRREGLLDEEEVELLEGALDLASTTAADIAVPTADLRTLGLAATAADVHAAAVESGFSRYPLLDGGGVPVSYVHVKDVLPIKGQPLGDRRVPARAVRPLPDIPADVSVEEVVQSLRAAGTHLGRVVDAGGRVLGVVALEDAIEELIGEVRDPVHR